MNSGPSERGFTLIEVLVALVACALLMAILLDGAVTAKSRQKNQLLGSDAALVAITNIEALRHDAGPPTVTDGEEDGIFWRLEETEIARDPRQTSVLVEAHITAGTKEKSALASFKKRYLKNLVRP